MNAKKAAAEKGVVYIKNGMVVGLGTGSTAYYAIQKLGEKVRSGFSIKAVASSIASENLAKELGIPVVPLTAIERIDITIDGADEIDNDNNLVKGGGGALLREKILASNSATYIVVVDELKLKKELGQFGLPVEITQFANNLTISKIEKLGCVASLRKLENKIFITDNGNFVVDCHFKQIANPAQLDIALKQIPGVVETGLFSHSMVNKIIVGFEDGTTKEIQVNG